MCYRQVPVLGINLGRLGFLADISPHDFSDCFEQVLQKNYQVTRHLSITAGLRVRLRMSPLSVGTVKISPQASNTARAPVGEVPKF